jgi:hypothetical protein
MTVDLEALQADLEGAGIPTEWGLDGDLSVLNVWFWEDQSGYPDADITVSPDGQVWIRDTTIYSDRQVHWTALDIIRRHIVPVSPVRADREALVEAARHILIEAEESRDYVGMSYVHDEVLDELRAALRATPEPERAE